MGTDDELMAASIDALEDLIAITEHARAALVEQVRAVCREAYKEHRLPEPLARLEVSLNELRDRLVSLERAESFEDICRAELDERMESIALAAESNVLHAGHAR